MVALPHKAKPSRRDITRLAAAGAGAALFTPLHALAQWPKEDEISRASLRARSEIGHAVQLAGTLLRQTVADGAERPGAAVRRFRAERPRIARSFATLLNGRVSEDDWPLLVPPRELDLQQAIQPLAIRLSPSIAALEAEGAKPLPQLGVEPGNDVADALLAIVLGCIGLPRTPQLNELAGRLKADIAVKAALDDSAAAVRAQRYGQAAFELDRLMRQLLPRNAGQFAESVGKDGLRAAYTTVVLYFVPFTGWDFFNAYLLASLYDNREALAPLLR